MGDTFFIVGFVCNSLVMLVTNRFIARFERRHGLSVEVNGKRRTYFNIFWVAPLIFTADFILMTFVYVIRPFGGFLVNLETRRTYIYAAAMLAIPAYYVATREIRFRRYTRARMEASSLLFPEEQARITQTLRSFVIRAALLNILAAILFMILIFAVIPLVKECRPYIP
ncbi:MAG: hypothetical protein LBS90_06980 [Oscillospiraceae bacterium]|jgi:hypothetical protein|nr:hypothetical protein [Oscillospiraceae bacterium]